MEKRDWLAERWLLRRIRLCGFAAPSNETIDAAVRAGAAVSRLAGAEALEALMRLGLLEQIDSILFLTKAGQTAAEVASRFARQLGEPAVPLPETHLPTVTWVDADFDLIETVPETATVARKPKEVSMSFFRSPEEEIFSLDDPEAGRKLAKNLDKRKVRLDFSELCAHFQCGTYEEKSRLRNFLIALDAQDILVEVMPNLYCRPALTVDRKGAGDKSASKETKKKIQGARQKREKKSAPKRDEEAAEAVAAATTETTPSEGVS